LSGDNLTKKIQKKAYFMFVIKLITRTKEYYRNRRRLKICGTMRWFDEPTSPTFLMPSLRHRLGKMNSCRKSRGRADTPSAAPISPGSNPRPSTSMESHDSKLSSFITQGIHDFTHRCNVFWIISITQVIFKEILWTLGLLNVYTVIQGISNHWEFWVSRRNLLKNY